MSCLNWRVTSPIIPLPLGGKLRKESQLEHVMPTPVEKLMCSRERVMTHSIAMLRSWKNEVVCPLLPPSALCSGGRLRCGKQLNKTHHLPHSSAAEQKQWSGMAQSVAAIMPLLAFKPEPLRFLTGWFWMCCITLFALAVKREMTTVIVKTTLLARSWGDTLSAYDRSSEASFYFVYIGG